MRSIGILAAVLFSGLQGCAHAPTAAAQAAYFQCEGASMAQVRGHLGAAGYKLAPAVDDTYGETGWTEFDVVQDAVKQQLTLRLKIEAATPGPRFSIWQSTADAQGEREWSEITEYQVKEDTYRALLNKIRKDVCGTPADYFEAP